VIVIDASASVHYLLDTAETGTWVGERLAEDGDLHTPHLLDVEVANVLRGLARGGLVPGARARKALEDLVHLNVTRYPHLPFLERIWSLRANLTAYDATYVALAGALGAPLLTTDTRIARAPGLGIRVLTP
jgi:predicted nucleic acid-binding protein